MKFTRLTVLLAMSMLPAAVFAKETPPPVPGAEALIERLGLEAAPWAVKDREGWAPPRVVAVRDPGSSTVGGVPLLDAIRAVAGDAEVVVYGRDSTDALAEADVVLGACSPDVVAAAPKLRWLHSFSVGVERCTLADGLAHENFILTNNQRGTGPDIAEHTIALMLGLTRNLDFYVREQHAGGWPRGERQAINVNGKTLLVLGLGGIGTEIARRAHGLGMRVVATRNSSREGPDFVDYVGLSEETLALAAQAQVVANALPLTDDTRGLVDAGFLAALPVGAIYLNVGRGGTTDTQALVDALASGRLGGVGLDVTDPEPLPADHPIRTMENVIITPHVSAHTDESRERTLTIGVENLRRYVAGEPLLSVVEFERGY